MNNQDESQEIELEVAKSMPLFPRSTVDDVIDSVVSHAYATEAVDDVIDMVARCLTDGSAGCVLAVKFQFRAMVFYFNR